MVVCVCVICLVQLFIRCVKEWNLAVNLHLKTASGVVVSAFGSVSRPELLKHFAYLDFMDKNKRGPAMKKLSEEIGLYVCMRVCVNFVQPT